MTKQEKYCDIVKQLQQDIRLEIILADLVTKAMSMDDLVIMSDSLFKRNYHRDIESIEEIEYPKSKKRRLSFTVNRNGIYDGLPQDLIHLPLSKNSNNNTDSVIEEMERQKQVEKSSRRFFLPLEQEFYRQKVKLEIEERKFLFETNDELPGSLFAYLWALPDYLDNLQKSKLGVLMPLLNGIAGDMDLTTFVIRTISGDNVSLFESLPAKCTIDESPVLGQTRMGIDSTLGGMVMEAQSSITVRIYLESEDSVLDYMPGGKKIVIHEFLCNLLIPFEKTLRFELDFSKARTQFTIEDDKLYTGRLNYTTFI